MSDSSLLLSIAILGGTGREGKGLAYRLAKAGYHIHIGSRDAEKAQSAVTEILNLLEGEAAMEGLTNLEAAEKSDIAVLTVPYAAHGETLSALKDALQGKILIDTTVPLKPPKVSVMQMPSAGSAGLEARQILGEGVEVCSAFQNVAHEYLLGDSPVDCDVLVTGTSKEAREQTLKLVEAAGLVGWDAGPLENSAVAEGLTSALIAINKKYGSTHAGIKITGVNRT